MGVLRGFESAYSQNEVAGTMQRFCLPTVTSDAQHRSLFLDGKIVLGIDHRLALSNPALVSAPSKKIL